MTVPPLNKCANGLDRCVGVGGGASVGRPEYTHYSELDYTSVPKEGEEMWQLRARLSRACGADNCHLVVNLWKDTCSPSQAPFRERA